MGNGEVVARAGESANEPEYVVSLYLPSDYSQRPTASLPHWFLELLQARGGAYHTLAEAACGLERLAALKGRMDIHQELLERNNFVTRRPNSRQHRRGGPEGPL